MSPDATALMIAWLRQELPTIPDQSEVGVYRAIPDPRPGAFVTVRLVGGAGVDEQVHVLDRVSLAIEAWANRVEQAHDLAQNARAVALAARGVVLGSTQVYRVTEFAAPVELPDPLSDQPRVTFTVELTLRRRRPT